jgi:hypothetical protein
MLKIGQIIAETCPGFELKKELCMESYDRYCHTDERISIIFPVAEDGFVGHSFSVWRDKVFDATERYALLRNHTAFERCTGNFDHIVDAYHLQANDVGTGIGKKTL